MSKFTGEEQCSLHVKGESSDYEQFNVVLHGTVEQCLMYVDSLWLSGVLEEEQDENPNWKFDYDHATKVILDDMVSENKLWSLVELTVVGHDPIILHFIDDVVHITL